MFTKRLLKRLFISAIVAGILILVALGMARAQAVGTPTLYLVGTEQAQLFRFNAALSTTTAVGASWKNTDNSPTSTLKRP